MYQNPQVLSIVKTNKHSSNLTLGIFWPLGVCERWGVSTEGHNIVDHWHAAVKYSGIGRDAFYGKPSGCMEDCDEAGTEVQRKYNVAVGEGSGLGHAHKKLKAAVNQTVKVGTKEKDELTIKTCKRYEGNDSEEEDWAKALELRPSKKRSGNLMKRKPPLPTHQSKTCLMK